MANKELFAPARGITVAAADMRNDAGGWAFAVTPEHALTQYALTCMFNGTFYVSSRVQLDRLIELCDKVTDLDYIARLAIYARHKGYMKDTPAFLLAYLSTKSYDKLEIVFNHVITDGKMLRNYVQMIRSGAVGRRSLGTRLKRMVANWIGEAPIHRLFNASIGNQPSLADVIKMVRPKPADETQAALFAWFLGKTIGPMDTPAEGSPEARMYEQLPPLCRDYDIYQLYHNGTDEIKQLINDSIEKGATQLRDQIENMPLVPHLMLTSMNLPEKHWQELPKQMTWNQLRKNLNMLETKGVFASQEVSDYIAERLANADDIRKARVFPHELLITYLNTRSTGKLPMNVIGALHDAIEVACENAPVFPGKRLVLACDVSGSMTNAVTSKAHSVCRNSDVAALITAAITRVNHDAAVMAFDGELYDLRAGGMIEPRDTIMTNATRLASHRGGATNCALPLLYLLENELEADLIILISDNESLIQQGVNQVFIHGKGYTPSLKAAWERYTNMFPKAKMVCIDVSPKDNCQVLDDKNVLNIGGFTDNVFKLVTDFMDGSIQEGLVGRVKELELK